MSERIAPCGVCGEPLLKGQPLTLCYTTEDPAEVGEVIHGLPLDQWPDDPEACEAMEYTCTGAAPFRFRTAASPSAMRHRVEQARQYQMLRHHLVKDVADPGQRADLVERIDDVHRAMSQLWRTPKDGLESVTVMLQLLNHHNGANYVEFILAHLSQLARGANENPDRQDYLNGLADQLDDLLAVE